MERMEVSMPRWMREWLVAALIGGSPLAVAQGAAEGSDCLFRCENAQTHCLKRCKRKGCKETCEKRFKDCHDACPRK